MMAKDDSDNKLTCNTSISKESNSNESFVKKVSTRVSDLIPSSLTKWFTRDERSSSVRYRDEDDDDSFTIQPPSKKAKLPTEPHFNYNNFSLSSLSTPTISNPLISSPCVSSVNNVYSPSPVPEPVAGPSGIKARKLMIPRSVERSDATDMLNGDKESDSGDSTSGYSSMARTAVRAQVFENAEASNSKIYSNSTFNSSSPKGSNNRTLFLERSLTPQPNTSLSSRRPSFNASTFGSPKFIDRTLSTKRILNSPFYNGRTIYGGASAYGRKLGRTSNDLQSSLRNSVHIKPVNEKPLSDNTALSKTARRILDTLEQYTTPVNDATKIPQPTKGRFRNEGLISKYVGANPYTREMKTTSNKALQVPSVPELLKLKEQLQESTESVRKMATTSKSDLNKKEYEIPTVTDHTNARKHNNKIKTKVTSVRQKPVESEAVQEVKLPNVALPISTLPKFDFSLPPPPSYVAKTPTDQSKEQQPLKIVTTTASNKSLVGNKESVPKVTNKENHNGTTEYKFSNPLVIAENLKSIIGINDFKFSDPICKKLSKSPGVINFKTFDSSEFNLKRTIPKNNGEIQTATKLHTSGSVMDILGKKSVDLFDKFKPQQGTWECSVCLIRNQAEAQKCAACTSSRTVPQPKVEEKKTSGFGSQFKMSSDVWECSSCMVRNKNEDLNCVACTSLKPGTKPEQKSNVSTTFNLASKFNNTGNTWECSTCLIRNNNEVDKCVACESRKPSLNNSKVSETKSTFGDSFKKKENEWECGTCLVKNANDKIKCQCCETPKPGSSVTAEKISGLPKFSFGVDQSTACSFTFGIKPANKVDSAAVSNSNISSVFGQAAKPAVAEDKPATFTFGIGASIKKTNEEPKVAENTSKTIPTEKPKETPVVSKQNEKQPEKIQPLSAFKFSPTTAPTLKRSAAEDDSPLQKKRAEDTPSTLTLNAQAGVKSDAPKKDGFTFAPLAKSESTIFSPKPIEESKTTTSNGPIPSIAKGFSFGEKSSAPSNIFGSTNGDTPKPTFNFSTTDNSKPSEKPSLFGSSNSTTTFGNSTTNLFDGAAFTPNFKTSQPTQEVKPFAFGSSASSTAKVSEVSFGQKAPETQKTNSAQPFTIGNTNTQSTTAGFKFGADKTAPPTFSFGAPAPSVAVFGQSNQQVQNGGFNFGSSAAASIPKTGFSFGTTENNPSTASGPMFNFGSSNTQPPAAGGFNFAASSTPAFNANVKPVINFTGGAAPSFSAQPNEPAPVKRVMRKAVRRTR